MKEFSNYNKFGVYIVPLIFMAPILGGFLGEAYDYIFYSLIIIPSLSGLYVIFKYRSINKDIGRVFLLLTFILYMIFMRYYQLYWGDYGLNKINQIIVIVVLFMYLMPAIFRSFNDLEIFYLSLFYLSLIIASILVLSYGASLGRYSIFDANPIWMARICGICGLVGAIMLVNSYGGRKKNRVNRSILYLSLLVSMVGIISTGSKGPMLSLLLSVLIIVQLKPRLKLSSTFFMLIVIGFLAYIVGVFLFDSLILERYSAISIQGSVAEGTRSELYKDGIDLILRFPFGVGFGGFSDYSVAQYPHNLLIEIFAEAGVIVGTVVLVVLSLSFIKAKRLTKVDNTSLDVLVGLFFYAFMNSMFSGDMISPKLLYFTMALIFIYKDTRLSSIRKTG